MAKSGSKSGIFVTSAAVVFVFCTAAFGQPWDGNGVDGDPYQIWDANDMQAIGADANYWGAHFELMADIDLGAYTGTGFNIIGERYYDSGWVEKPFRGVFDGDGHTIFSFTYHSDSSGHIGLFGYINDPNAEVKNLGLVGPNIDAGTSGAGGCMVGYVENGTIRDCYVEEGIVRGESGGGLAGRNDGDITGCHSSGSVTGREDRPSGHLGGLVGYNDGDITGCYSEGGVTGVMEVGGLVGDNRSNISNCHSTCSVTGTGYFQEDIGGLVGHNEEGSILNSYSTGDVTGEYEIGGLVGYNDDGGDISGCYSMGSVSGKSFVGGLIGENRDGYITSCYSTGSVTGEWGYVGGLVGCARPFVTIENCYSTGSVTAIGDYVGGLVGRGRAKNSYWDVNSSSMSTSSDGVGLTSEQMRSKGTYLFWGCEQESWTIDDGNDYPKLLWEGKPGEIIDFGCGSAEEPYLIYEAVQMHIISDGEWNLDKHYKLAADIDLGEYTGSSFNMIGYNFYYENSPFRGVFDGAGHAISNFTYDSNDVESIGLFGWVDDPNAEIKNLGLIDPDVNAGDYPLVGCLIGRLAEGVVTDCYVEGGSVRGGTAVGGLVGHSGSFNVSNCYSTCSVTGDRGVGGLVGFGSGNIANCYSAGRVIGIEDAGGLVGRSRFNISNSYSSSSVTGGNYVGGLVGYNSRVVLNCYSSGSVAGDSNVGGLVGYDFNLSGDYTASFWDTEVSPEVNGIGNLDEPNVVGLPTVLMHTKSTFVDAGWDFNTPIWTIDDGNDYPRLWWENGVPVACIVGGDRVVEADSNCEARVVLDGSCSSDEDSTEGTNDDINDFDWYEVIDACEPNSDIYLGSGEVIECNLGLGEHLIILEVTDEAGAFDSNEVVITVEDDTPPEFSLVVEPNILWPPNGKMVQVRLEWEVSDNCDEEVEVSLVDISMSAAGDINDYVVIGGDGSTYLRARKSKGGSSRIYTLTYEAVDDSGNVAEASATVMVPHRRGPVKRRGKSFSSLGGRLRRLLYRGGRPQ